MRHDPFAKKARQFYAANPAIKSPALLPGFFFQDRCAA
jgi:hypothetical protein